MREHGTTLGQYSEVMVAIVQALPKALEGLNLKKVIKSLQNRGGEFSHLLREDVAELMVMPVFSRDMRKEDWELLEDVGDPDPAEIIIADLEVVSFLKGDETLVSGEVMRNRAVELQANLGQRHAEFLLKHQEEIPKEFRKFYLVFPGTVWRDPCYYPRVPCLRRRGRQWTLYFRWIEGDRFSCDRLVRLCK